MSEQSVFNRGIRVLSWNDILWVDEAGAMKPIMINTRIIPYLQFFNPLNLKSEDLDDKKNLTNKL